MTETDNQYGSVQDRTRTATVLVADDDAGTRRLLRTMLEGDGYEVLEAAHGDEALDTLRCHRVDAALLDLAMPGRDGRQVLRELRKDDLGAPQFPVLIVSGHEQADLAVSELRLGAHDYIRKPFEPNELLARVSAAVRVGHVYRSLHDRMAQLQLLACTDALTGLPNRRALERALLQADADARRHGETYSVVMVDVDRFKAVNDDQGHAGGDQVLAAVASILAAHLRAADTAGRWGGDEFLIVIPRADEQEALTIAERIRSEIGAATDGRITLSAGVAAGPFDMAGESTIDRADRALGWAKAKGRDRVEVAAR